MSDAQLIAAFLDALGSRDPDAFADICAPGLHYEDPLTPVPIETPAALAAHLRRLWEGFPDVRVEVAGELLRTAPDALEPRIAVPVKLLATHRGELEGLPPTGRFVVVPGILYCQLDDAGERLWRVRAVFDLYGAAVQLGVLPRQGTLGEKALLMLRGFGVRAGRP